MRVCVSLVLPFSLTLTLQIEIVDTRRASNPNVSSSPSSGSFSLFGSGIGFPSKSSDSGSGSLWEFKFQFGFVLAYGEFGSPTPIAGTRSLSHADVFGNFAHRSHCAINGLCASVGAKTIVRLSMSFLYALMDIIVALHGGYMICSDLVKWNPLAGQKAANENDVLSPVENSLAWYSYLHR